MTTIDLDQENAQMSLVSPAPKAGQLSVATLSTNLVTFNVLLILAAPDFRTPLNFMVSPMGLFPNESTSRASVPNPPPPSQGLHRASDTRLCPGRFWDAVANQAVPSFQLAPAVRSPLWDTASLPYASTLVGLLIFPFLLCT